MRNVPESEKTAVYHTYGIYSHAPDSYEIDHLISLELGGSNAQANLWPEKYAQHDGARTKDVVENALHRRVCNGQMTLAAAQHAIASNWESVR